MNPLTRVPRLNNAWMDFKHRLFHRRKRRNRDVGASASVSEPRNVLMVVVDCLRADHVSGFGHERATTPNLDALDAAAFPNAKAPSTWTFPSVPSLLSGRYPHEHGGRFENDPRNLSAQEFPQRPRADVPTLPDLLETAGYETGMITAIPMAEKAVGDRFQHVSVRYTEAAERAATAREWIAGRDRWFCYLHLGDPHAPLDISPASREEFDVPSMADLEYWRFRETTDGDAFEAYRDARIRAYDGAIRDADAVIAELLGSLGDETIVVVCGDHGEALWDHPELERRLNDDPRGYYATDHGHSVLEEVARVPLWVRAPGVDARRADDPVSLVDVVPTVLDVLGADVPDGVSGRHLRDRPASEPLLCEETAYGYNQRAVWRDGRKAIAVPETDERVAFELDGYLEGDPLDSVPDPLADALARFGGGVEGGDRMAVDAETRDRLEELGYLESDSG
ncbi:arylsulfatase [Halobacteriales archaeon QS_1_67_19]|nr:MAG: arylsulfatase [Halobacteriales archaeon QS_1_67_19]